MTKRKVTLNLLMTKLASHQQKVNPIDKFIDRKAPPNPLFIPLYPTWLRYNLFDFMQFQNFGRKCL